MSTPCGGRPVRRYVRRLAATVAATTTAAPAAPAATAPGITFAGWARWLRSPAALGGCRAFGRAVGLLGAPGALLLGPRGIGLLAGAFARATPVATPAPVEGAGSGTAPPALLAALVRRWARGAGRHYLGTRGGTGLGLGLGQRAGAFSTLGASWAVAAARLAGFGRSRCRAGFASLGAVATVFVFALALAALAARFYLVVEAVEVAFHEGRYGGGHFFFLAGG